MKRKMIPLAAAFALALGTAGCGKSDPKESTSPSSTSAIVEDKTTEAPPATTIAPEADTTASEPETTVAPSSTDAGNDFETYHCTNTITGRPQFLNVPVGSAVVLKVDIPANEDVSLQWQFRPSYGEWKDSAYVTSRTDTLTFMVTKERDYRYRCMIQYQNGTTKYSDTVYTGDETEIPITDDFFGEGNLLFKFSAYDLDHNQTLSPSEREQVTKLDLSAIVYSGSDFSVVSPYRDIKGIEYFENLEKLICSNNSLKDLDLSKCPNLKYLDCSGNELSNLDLSRTPKLTALYCERNQLTSLDLTNNPGLETLSCHNNQLTTLDLSQNQNLKLANVVANALTDLNISGLKTLRGLECWNNPLTAVDTAGCTSLERFSVDAAASVTGLIDTAVVFRRYEPSALKDGYYYSSLTDGDPSLAVSAAFRNIEADLDTLSIDGWFREGLSFWYQCPEGKGAAEIMAVSFEPDDNGYFGHFPRYNVASLPLAKKVTFYRCLETGERTVYNAPDLNTFMNDMKAIKESYNTDDTTGDIMMQIHISDGFVDEIAIEVIMYP